MTEKQQTFAEAMTALEEIVRQLEQGDVPLENAIDLYKQGMELSKFCHSKSQHAEEQTLYQLSKRLVKQQHLIH